MGIYLGLDSSTQGLKGILIDAEKGNVISSESINFGNDLSKYNCADGTLYNDNPLIKHSNPLMWLEALDLLLTKFQKSNAPLCEVRGISGMRFIIVSGFLELAKLAV